MARAGFWGVRGQGGEDMELLGAGGAGDVSGGRFGCLEPALGALQRAGLDGGGGLRARPCCRTPPHPCAPRAASPAGLSRVPLHLSRSFLLQ